MTGSDYSYVGGKDELDLSKTIDSIVALRSGRISAHGPHGISLEYRKDFFATTVVSALVQLLTL